MHLWKSRESWLEQGVLTVAELLRLPCHLFDYLGRTETNCFPDNLVREAREAICCLLSKTLAASSQITGQMFDQQITQSNSTPDHL
jgi:hypothetical protein